MSRERVRLDVANPTAYAVGDLVTLAGFVAPPWRRALARVLRLAGRLFIGVARPWLAVSVLFTEWAGRVGSIHKGQGRVVRRVIHTSGFGVIELDPEPALAGFGRMAERAAELFAKTKRGKTRRPGVTPWLFHPGHPRYKAPVDPEAYPDRGELGVALDPDDDGSHREGA